MSLFGALLPSASALNVGLCGASRVGGSGNDRILIAATDQGSTNQAHYLHGLSPDGTQIRHASSSQLSTSLAYTNWLGRLLAGGGVQGACTVNHPLGGGSVQVMSSVRAPVLGGSVQGLSSVGALLVDGEFLGTSIPATTPCGLTGATTPATSLCHPMGVITPATIPGLRRCG